MGDFTQADAAFTGFLAETAAAYATPRGRARLNRERVVALGPVERQWLVGVGRSAEVEALRAEHKRAQHRLVAARIEMNYREGTAA